MPESHYLTTVKEQYENFPYPYRRPEDEKKRLIRGVASYLAKINHYCYEGKENFKNSFRVLVAGGGTGDVVVFMAEQLRDTNAEIVCLDISTASMEIARQRAVARGLDNIKWIHGSLLDLGQMGLGEFDYIDCAGVLHHLEDPVEGLRSLKTVLKKNGVMCLLVYGKYARTGVYQVQELMRLINGDEHDMQIQLDNTKTILNCLPQTNWYKRAESLFNSDIDAEHVENRKIVYGNDKNCDIEVYDTFLHSQDRAYTVPELYEWLQGCGLNLIDFVENRTYYIPERYITDPGLLQKVNALPLHKRQAITELIGGTLKKHAFYTSVKTDTVAKLTDLDNIPFFFRYFSHDHFYGVIKDLEPGKTLSITLKNGEVVNIPIGKYTRYIFKYMDGNRSIREILESIKLEEQLGQGRISEEEIFEDLRIIYNTFNVIDIMVLRDKSVGPFKSYRQM